MDDNKKDIIEELVKKGSSAGAEEKVRNSFLGYFKKHKTSLGLGERIEALYDWLVEGRFQGKDKLVLIGALVYFINPLDVVPDITPFIGFIDDLGVLGLAYRYLQNRAIEEHDKKSDQ